MKTISYNPFPMLDTIKRTSYFSIMAQLYDYLAIIDASPLGGYKLLIDWSSGEQTIFDASSHMNSQRALLHRSPDEFNKVKVHPGFLYWGTDEDDPEAFMIMQDDVYEGSFPYSAIVSSGVPMFLSMARISDLSDFPLKKNFPNARAYAHPGDADRHKEPHIHIYLHTGTTIVAPFKLDGTLIAGITLPNPPFSGKVLRAIKKWIVSNRATVVAAWNKENPNSQVTV